MSRFALLVSLLFAVPAATAPVPKVKLPEVEILPLATALLPGERLILYVQFVNRGPDEVFEYDSSFSDPKHGTTVVEVRGPDDDDFRRPYDLHSPMVLQPLAERKKGPVVAPGGWRQCRLFLPWHDEEEKHPVFNQPGKWQVRARVLWHGGLENVSEAVTITVAKRTAEQTKKLQEGVARLNRSWAEESKGDRVEKCHELHKLTDALGPCYTADESRSGVLVFRLYLTRIGESKESQADVLKEIDAHAKTLPNTHRTYLFCRVADTLLDRKRKANTLESLALVRKYAGQMDRSMDDLGYILKVADEEEKRLKAKPPVEPKK